MDAQREEIRAAGERNATAQARLMAVGHARRQWLRDTTGLRDNIVDWRKFRAAFRPLNWGAAYEAFGVAYRKLMVADFAEVDVALGRAEDLAVPDRAGQIAAARAKIRQAAACPRPALTPLVRMGRERDEGGARTVTAVDHTGAEFRIMWRAGAVTVCGAQGEVSGPDGGDPTRAARELAGLLSGGLEAGRLIGRLAGKAARAVPDRVCIEAEPSVMEL
jgi:hypothetical protein